MCVKQGLGLGYISYNGPDYTHIVTEMDCESAATHSYSTNCTHSHLFCMNPVQVHRETFSFCSFLRPKVKVNFLQAVSEQGSYFVTLLLFSSLATRPVYLIVHTHLLCLC